MVLLSTSDSKEFIVDKEVAERMTLINGPELETSDQAIPLLNVSSDVLEKILEYCEYHRGEPLDQNNIRNTTEWDQNFIAQVNVDMLMKIIKAANYLEMKPLLELGAKTVADMIKGKSADQIRALLNIANGTPDGPPFSPQPSNHWTDSQS
ncbi:hypothetical protein V5O48_008701 [Marasmius crinis-equi]|uniref:E3 ubiquitin ligase complex SCF subunit n=1 Tax=Marasmius crinis-equi TaxID=585013 RepID=A0ABR3FDE2_9AGAR